ncbi:MAG: M48 family metalloprotease [Thermoanaerobaculia bacterium]|nr:M48 family metalloprotease [Thermoanaerobaculia bacterium]
MKRLENPARRFAAAALAAAAGLAGCSVNPATGERQVMLMSEAQEIAIGREADPEIVAEMGLYDDPGLQQYVSGLGRELAAKSERPDLPWTFRVLDDPTVNAFALPGGFIYVTRGILSHLETEAELVAVLGHEIGHVTARHGANRLSKAQLAQVGLVVGSVASPEFARFAGLAETGLGLLFLKYSRDDERQADELGLRYTIRGGYDAREMPEVFSTLERVSRAEGGDRGALPSWLSTHPDPGARRERALQAIAESGIDFGGTTVAREEYLGRLDGLVFGDNPREGFFRGGRFLHPDLRFQLDFPAEWKTRNTRRSVDALSPQQDAALRLALSPEADPYQAARQFLAQGGISAEAPRRGEIGGFPAAGGYFEVPGERPLAGRVAFLRDGDTTFMLLGYTLQDKWRGYSSEIGGFVDSYRRLTDPEALAVQPARLQIVEPSSDLPLERFAQQYGASVPLETLALINQMEVGQVLRAGRRAKTVHGGLGS